MQTKNKAKDARERIRLTLLNLTVVETESIVESRIYCRDITYRRDKILLQNPSETRSYRSRGRIRRRRQISP